MDTNDDTLHVNDAIEDISNDSIQSFNVPSKGLHELLLLCYPYLSQPQVLVQKRQRLQEHEDRSIDPPLKKIKNMDNLVIGPFQEEMQEVQFK